MSNGFRCVVVDSVQDTYYISAKDSDGKMNVRGPSAVVQRLSP